MENLKVIQTYKTYCQENLGDGRYRLVKVIKEYDDYDEMTDDALKLLNNEVTEEQVYKSWKK